VTELPEAADVVWSKEALWPELVGAQTPAHMTRANEIQKPPRGQGLVRRATAEVWMGRKKEWPERVGATAGTLDRIADGEERTAFIREAVERELAHREKAAAKANSPKQR
jgi:hypothetical protein